MFILALYRQREYEKEKAKADKLVGEIDVLKGEIEWLAEQLAAHGIVSQKAADAIEKAATA